MRIYTDVTLVHGNEKIFQTNRSLKSCLFRIDFVKVRDDSITVISYVPESGERPTLSYCWATGSDAGPMVKQHWASLKLYSVSKDTSSILGVSDRR